jgi:hypothetical protein
MSLKDLLANPDLSDHERCNIMVEKGISLREGIAYLTGNIYKWTDEENMKWYKADVILLFLSIYFNNASKDMTVKGR